MPRVLNVKTATTSECVGAVPIWRGTKWGNPNPMKGTVSRAEAVERYRRYLDTNPDLKAAAIAELRGRDLLCYCYPRMCHGDVLVEIANA